MVQVSFLYRTEKLPSYYGLLITEHLFFVVEPQARNQEFLSEEVVS